MQVDGFPPGYNPRPAESRAAPDSSMTPAAVAARLASASAGRGGGGGGGGFRGAGASTPITTGDYRVVLSAGGKSYHTVLRVVEVTPSDRAVMVPAMR